MRVMVLLKATEDSEKGFVSTPETMAVMEAMGKFNDELVKAGILRDGDGLRPSSDGKRMLLMARSARSSTDLSHIQTSRRRFLALGGQGHG